MPTTPGSPSAKKRFSKSLMVLVGMGTVLHVLTSHGVQVPVPAVPEVPLAPPLDVPPAAVPLAPPLDVPPAAVPDVPPAVVPDVPPRASEPPAGEPDVPPRA